MQLTKWLNTVVKTMVLLSSVSTQAQVIQSQERLTLQQAYDLAQQHYPMIRQKDLVRRTATLNIENIGKGYLPQLNITGQATYQSEVTSIPVKVPGIDIDAPSKDQYKIQAELSQLIYDGGNTSAQKNVQRVN